jgi:transposase
VLAPTPMNDREITGGQRIVMMWTASPERHQVPRHDRCRSRIGKPSMKTFIRIGIDLAKNFFQVHAIEREGAPAVTRKLSRGKVLAFFAQTAPCRVGMEACGSSHYWAREIRALGHEVVLIPPAYTKPYVKRGKNDANDAAAICEAMSRPEMRFVPIKSADQQAVLMLHKTRELLVKQRTMTVNALRGHLSEFGLIAPKGIQRVKELLKLALVDETLPEEARQATAMLASHGDGLDERIDDLEKKIARASGRNQTSRLLDEIPAFGPVIASAMVAFNPDPSVFRSGCDFSASLGITPSQNSSGGKDKLGGITKKGNRYLRKMLVVGCTSVLRVAHKYKGALAEWIVAIRARKPERVVAVALANKLARIAWAMMTTGESFRAELYTKA